MDVPYRRVLGEQLEDAAELVLVGDIGKHGGSRRVKVTDGGVQPLPVRGAHGGLVKGGAERVERDIDGVGVSANLEEVTHDVVCVAPELANKLGKVLDPVLDEGGLYDLDLDLFQHVTRVAEPIGRLLQELGEVGTDGGVDKDGLVQVGIAPGIRLKCGNRTHGGLLEHSQGVALGDEFVDVTAREGSLEKEHYVLDHVFKRDEIKEGG